MFDTFTNATNDDAINATISENSITSSNVYNIKFMYFHILIDILSKMSDNVNGTSKQEMIDYLKQKYNEDERKRNLIDELDRDYMPSNAIRWYTKDTFLYGLLNEALRNSDFDALFALRSFIVDLYKQITMEREQLFNNTPINRDECSLTVYRGQKISKEELNILRQKQGGYFSMQGFLSTSTNPQVADIYLDTDVPHTEPNTEWILYEIKIDTNLSNTKPYAHISHLSQYEAEDEVLIALGAIFRIHNIQFDNVNYRWHAVLNLCDVGDFDLYDMMQQYAAEIVADRVSPGFLLYQQGNYVKATEYFQRILSITSLTISEKAHCYRGLGAVAAEEKNYDKAYKSFLEELAIWEELDDEVNTMEAYKNIGDILFYMGKFKEALEYLQTAAIYFRLNDYKMEYARIYGMIGQIMCVNEQWDNCLMCYELQLEVRERILDPNHEDIGITHANIGAAYIRMKNYEKAVEHFRKARIIFIHSHPPDHPNVLKAEENLRNAIHLLNERQ